MTEAELCLKLEKYHAGYDVYKEVPTDGGRCDMYVKKGPVWVAVEVKCQFSTGLIYQAMRNMPYAHYSYVAIPDLKSSYNATRICKALGIGVLQYGERFLGKWHIMVPAAYRRNIVPLRVLDVMKLAVAGVQHNSMSEYKITIAQITRMIERNGGKMKIKELFDKDHFHYCSARSAMQCITKIASLGKIPEFTQVGKEFVLNKKLTA